MASETFISIRNLYKSLGRQEVLRGVDLDVQNGETLVVIGRSGGGKSVLLKHIIGLMKPSKGEVLVEGVNIAEMSERQMAPIRKQVAILFQSGALFDSMSVEQNVAFPLRESGLKDPKEIDQKVAEALEVVNLAGEQKKMPENLSGGMRKRVGLARAIVSRPACILYDEPTTGLDPIVADGVNHLIRRLQKRFQVTSIVVTHDMKSAFHVADQVAYLYDGRIYFKGTPKELQASEDPIIQNFIQGRSEGKMGSVSNKENGLEVKVGLFICIGMAVILAMVVEFGLSGEGFKKSYPLTLDLPNANGLLKGSDVLLAGADVGTVATKPILSSNLGTVRVTVNIDEDIKIPRNSAFKVDSSGLLGDKFVAITTPPDFKADQFDPKDPKQAYQPGDNIVGTHTGDIAELAGPALEKLSKELDELQKATAKLSDGLLSDANLSTVHATLVSLKTSSDNFAEASKGFSGIVQNASEAVDKAKETMTTADAAAADVRKVLDSAKVVIQKATQGDGLIAALLTNRELTENLKALVINLREHGVLFYRNSDKTGAAGAEPSPSPGRANKKR